jgi:hypothetical protein
MATTSDRTDFTAPATDRDERFARTDESAPATSGSPIDSHASPTADTGTRSGKATAGFVVGIIALIAAFPLAPLGLLLGIIGTVLGNVGRKEARAQGKTNAWMGTAGFWLGISAIALSVIFLIIGGVIAAS